MTTDVSSHGPGMLMGMLHMPTLVSSTATDSPLMMFSSPAAAADGFGQSAHAAMSSGMSDSQMDVVHSDAAAAQLLESQAGLTLAAQEAALNQLKRACKAAKSERFGAKLYFQNGHLGICSTHSAGAGTTASVCGFHTYHQVWVALPLRY